MSGTQLYNKDSQKIYPETEASAVTLDDDYTVETKFEAIDESIKTIKSQISKLDGAESVAKSLQFDIKYALSTSKEQNDIIGSETTWVSDFQTPDATYPYVWKRTKISYDGQDEASKQTIYEIVLADIADISQSIYRSQNNQSQPSITYPQAAENIPNYQAPLNDILGLNSDWSTSPTDISAANPYRFIAVRNRADGKWGEFKVALDSRWTFDSNIVIKYQVVDSLGAPEVSKATENPGVSWKDSITSDFTGYVYIITASQSNKSYMQDTDGNIWSDPSLISIVK